MHLLSEDFEKAALLEGNKSYFELFRLILVRI